MKSRPASGGGQSVFWLEIPWLPDKFHWEHWVCGPGQPGLGTVLDEGFVVEPPRRRIIRGVMGCFVPNLASTPGWVFGRRGA